MIRVINCMIATLFIAINVFADSLVDASNACSEPHQTFEKEGDTFYCFFGKINSENADIFIQTFNQLDIDYLVIDSPGGDVASAMRMGDVLRAEGSRIIVKKSCHSSCANYLVSAPDFKLVRRMPGAVISMHGSMPRHWLSYKHAARDPRNRTEIQSSQAYEDHIDGLAMREFKYFASHSTPEDYIKFFNHIRPMLRSQNPACAPKKGVLFIPDREFLSAHGIVTDPFDWPMDEDKILETLSTLKANYSMYVGFGLDPIWLSDVGRIHTKNCLERGTEEQENEAQE